MQIDGKWGFCDRNGQIVISAQFSGVSSFNENGFAAVCTDEKWGTVNESGEIVIEPQYSRITFDGDLTDLFMYWDDGGADIYMIDDGNYMYGLISDEGEVLAEPQLLIPPIFAPNGLAQVKTEQGNAYIDTSGQIVIELYDAIDFSAFKNGYASIIMEEEGNEFFVFIDESGKVIGSNRYEFIGSFSKNGLAPAAHDGKYGYIDRQGAFLISPQFDSAKTFDTNGYAIVGKDSTYAILNESGELMTQYLYEECYKTRSNNQILPFSTFAVVQNGLWGIVSKDGESLINPQFDDIWFSDLDSYEGDFFLNLSMNRLAMVISNEKRGIITLQGELLLEPIAEQGSMIVSPNGMTAVCVDGKYGYVDLDG